MYGSGCQKQTGAFAIFSRLLSEAKILSYFYVIYKFVNENKNQFMIWIYENNEHNK